MAIPCPKSSLRNITFPHPQLVISGTKVYFREITRSLELIKQVINSRQRISVLDSHFIQLSIINTHSERTILLPYKQHRSTPWRDTRSNETLLKQILQLLF